jgi:predicted enzyme related to lactoylglutathione lyase
MANPIVHFEIGCRNREKTQDFFANLFDWSIEVQGPVAMINTGAESGIQGHISVPGHDPHNYTLVYVEVDNLENYLKKAEGLGGKMLIPPTEIPEAGSFAWFADPEGNPVGLWKPLG